MEKYDCTIIGSGPNGLSAGIYLAQKGLKVLILEAASTPGGGMRTAQLTLPGFHHDVCAAVHPTGFLSPWFKQLALEQFGLEWIFPEVSVAHPLDGQPAVLLSQSVNETAMGLGIDANAYRRLLQPLAEHIDWLMEDSLAPLGIPKNLGFMAGFGAKALLPAQTFARWFFKEERAKALFAGCAGHTILPFDQLFTAAMGLVFLAMGHAVRWPVARGGSQSIVGSMVRCFEAAGGQIRCNTHIRNKKEIPPSKVILFDTDPYQLADIMGDELPTGYAARLRRYHLGPGVFKVDYALAGPIPWKDPQCLRASTVHVGGTLAEIAAGEKQAWNGHHSDHPFVLVAQQSLFDSTRSPAGQHTGWAYCHVPHGSTVDMNDLIDRQIERFAPGFRDLVLARSSMNSPQYHAYNANYVGGAVTGGAIHLPQLFTRPVARLNPYSTPNPKVFICSASTPPGGGVHGMNGYHAARSVFKQVFDK